MAFNEENPKTNTTQLAGEFREFVEEEKNNHKSVQEKLDTLYVQLQAQALVEAGRQHLYGKIEMQHRTLYGDPDKPNMPGLIQRVADLEKMNANITRLTWIVVGEFVAIAAAALMFTIGGG